MLVSFFMYEYFFVLFMLLLDFVFLYMGLTLNFLNLERLACASNFVIFKTWEPECHLG